MAENDETIPPENGDSDNLLDKLTRAVNGLTKLNIVTKVSDGSKNQIKMETVIDLVDGDITNNIHRDFVVGELKELRAFHESQVNRGQDIIKENIAALKAIFELAIETAQEK